MGTLCRVTQIGNIHEEVVTMIKSGLCIISVLLFVICIGTGCVTILSDENISSPCQKHVEMYGCGANDFVCFLGLARQIVSEDFDWSDITANDRWFWFINENSMHRHPVVVAAYLGVDMSSLSDLEASKILTDILRDETGDDYVYFLLIRTDRYTWYSTQFRHER